CTACCATGCTACCTACRATGCTACCTACRATGCATRCTACRTACCATTGSAGATSTTGTAATTGSATTTAATTTTGFGEEDGSRFVSPLSMRDAGHDQARTDREDQRDEHAKDRVRRIHRRLQEYQRKTVCNSPGHP